MLERTIKLAQRIIEERLGEFLIRELNTKTIGTVNVTVVYGYKKGELSLFRITIVVPTGVEYMEYYTVNNVHENDTFTPEQALLQFERKIASMVLDTED